MKVNFRMIVLLVPLASTAFGAGQVWYAAVGNNANSMVVNQGAPGGRTDLDCPGPGFGSWTITVHYTLADGGATGWALDYYGNTPLISASGVNVPTSALAASVSAGTVPNAGGTLMVGQNGANITPGGAPAGDYILETFTLNSPSCTGGFVYAGIGSAEFGGNDPNGFDIYEIVQIGSNVPRPGYSNGGGDPNGAEPAPVISIGAPEPASLSLLIIALPFFKRPTRS